MSHTTTLKGLAIRDVDAMHKAVADLKAKGVNCSLVRNAKPRMYYQSQHGECEFVLKLHDAPYDVGFDKQDDGTYAPVFDEWAGHVGRQIGATCPMPDTPEGKAQHAIGQFSQSYARHAAINSAVSQGYLVESDYIDNDGNVQLVLTV